MTYLIPVLLTLMRFAWLWPWLLLLKSFLSPSYVGELAAPWQLLLIPLLGLMTVSWATTSASSSLATDGVLTNVPDSERTELAWRTRWLAALTGFVVILVVVWWHYYRTIYGPWDPRWLYDLGYLLTHWGNQELPPQLLTLLLLIYLWLRGVGDAVRAMTHDDVWSALVRSVTAIVLYVAVLSIAGQPLPTNIFYLIVLLFGSGMLALAFSSLKITIGLDRALGMGQRLVSATPPINRYWLSSVGVTIAGLLGLGLLVTAILAPEQLQGLLDLAGAVLGWIGRMIGAVLLMLSYVIFLIVYFLFQFLEPLLQRLMERLAESPLTDMLAAMEPTEEMQQVAEGAAAVPESYRWVSLIIGIGIVVLIFALALRRLRVTTVSDEDEVRESILTTELLQEQLSGLWQRWFGRRRSPHDPFLSLDGEVEPRRRIRALYQELLAGAASVGEARTPAETPREYEQHLDQSLPEHEQVLAEITAAYHQARYASDAPDSNQWNTVQQAWATVKARFYPQQEEDAEEVDENTTIPSLENKLDHRSDNQLYKD